MKNFIEYVIKALVDNPDSVQISEIYGKHNVILEVRCHSSDMGRVIGRSGKTIGSVRMLLSTIAARQGRHSMLEVVE